ncbi:Lysosomal-associated transmembrane protein 4B [Sarcoptes scabiei]|nr:Lysosomal-associated transmembrane protein 4B [Sarcoptes scabiei]
MICALLTFFFMVDNSDYVSQSYLATRFRDEVNRINLISLLMYLMLALVSAMLLYGVIKSRPRYILPFFGIQFIDYLFTLPQFFASITHPYHYYVSKSKSMFDVQDNKTDLDDIRNVWSYSSYSSNAYTTSLLILTLIMIFKTYFLCVVWKCYRYLHMKELILPITLNAGSFDAEHILPPTILVGSATNVGSVPPPNYDEATKLPDYKPPEYTTVITTDKNPSTLSNNSTSSNNLDIIPKHLAREPSVLVDPSSSSTTINNENDNEQKQK